jgi:hypothetical protein
MYDISIKDEGSFLSVYMNTEEAKKHAEDSALKSDFKDIWKIDIANGEAHRILAWATSHGMTVESEVDIVTPKK